jgi:hypothetical protein
MRIFGKFLVLGFLCFCLWAFSGRAVVSQEGTQNLPIIVKQLEAKDGVIPVELKCAPASLPAPDTLEKFSCVLKNNTRKSITAANVSYSIVIWSNGKESRDTTSQIIETLVDESIYEPDRAIASGAASDVRAGGPTRYYGSTIQRMEMEIDYVEFEDGTTLGLNQTAAEAIAEIREGAAACKAWLIKAYGQSSKSVRAIAPLLEKEHSLPESLLKGSYQRAGAETYRRRVLNLYKTRGAAEVSKRLDK